MAKVYIIHGPEPEDRPRFWHAAFLDGIGGKVLLQHHAIREPNEDLTEKTPQKFIDWDEWTTTHEDYGLDPSGSPLESELERREAVLNERRSPP